MKRQRAAEKLRRRKHWYVICQLYCEMNWDSGIPSYRSNTQSLATSHKIFLSDKMEFFLKIGFSALQISMLKEHGGKYKLSWQCVAGIACGAIFSAGGDLLCAETKVDSVQRQQHTLPRFDPGGWKKKQFKGDKKWTKTNQGHLRQEWIKWPARISWRAAIVPVLRSDSLCTCNCSAGVWPIVKSR